MQEAIRRAIEGGWDRSTAERIADNPYANTTDNTTTILNECKMFMDSLFWQALGKACGWGTEMVLIDEPGRPKEWCFYYHCPVCGEIIANEEDGCDNMCSTDNPLVESWLHTAKEFHEINLTNGFEKAVEWLEGEIK